MSSFDELARALVLSHLAAIHIKDYLGKLSALCGCVIASTGSVCGIVMLNGGGYDQIYYAVKNMIGNITNICVSGLDGIIEDDVENTIRNLGTIVSQGMQATDEMILNIMTCK